MPSSSKKSGVTLVEKLRTIFLFQGDVNYLNKYIVHHMMKVMAHSIFEGTLEHIALSNSAIQEIFEQLHKHPAIDNILKPRVTPGYLKSAFKCVPGKKASSFSGRGVKHYKARAYVYDDGLADIKVELHTAMMTVPLDAVFCPERWKQAVDGMLEKVPGISRSDKLRSK
jgi:hypothetical protein